MRDLRAYLLALFVTLLALGGLSAFLTGDAEAQGTGGSFGGGDWGSGGSGGSTGGGGGGDWGSGGGGGYGTGGGYGGGYGTGGGYSGGGYSGGGGGMNCGGLCCVGIIVGIILVLVVISNRRRGGGGGPPMAGGGIAGAGNMGGNMGGASHYAGPNAMYVTAISVGLDWRARKQLQDQLKRLAETGDTRSPAGLAHLLSETVLALRRNEISWLFAHYRDEGGLAPQNAQPTFARIAQDFRSRFQSELVRGAAGQMQAQDAPAMRARAEEGEGTVVVTIVLASRRPMQGFHLADAAQVRAALSDRGALQGAQLVALEVIWSPAAENDRMSTAELEAVYPELKLIDPNSIAGRIFCTYCNGPFAAELISCPHCGAPAENSRNRTSPKG